MIGLSFLFSDLKFNFQNSKPIVRSWNAFFWNYNIQVNNLFNLTLPLGLHMSNCITISIATAAGLNLTYLTRVTGIYRWRIILADTNFFQQLVSVSAANIRGRNNQPSAKHIFIKFYVHMLLYNCQKRIITLLNRTEFW